MEKIVLKISNKLTEQLDLDNEKKLVVFYGLLALFQIIISFFFIILIGLILGVMFEALIFCLSVSILRKYSGGAHASSVEICTIFGVIACITFPMIIKYIYIYLYNLYFIVLLIIITFLLSFILIYKLAPVDSPNKPIKTNKKRKRMRKNSFSVLVIYLFISIVFLILGKKYSVFFRCNLSLLFGIFWQVLTLTKFGKNILTLINIIFNRIFYLREVK